MKKIPTLFRRDPANMRNILREVHPDCGWVIAGEGTATRKFDGTCVLIRGGKMFRRHELQPGKAAPEGFEPAMPEPDPETGKLVGWLPVGDGPEDRWHRDAMESGKIHGQSFPDWTYELCGPKVQGNPERFPGHTLVQHGRWRLPVVPTDYDDLRACLADHDIEGIVWWKDLNDPDCAKAKLKLRDFGLKRKSS